MSDCVDSDRIENIVGAERQPWLHLGRAVSAEQRVYILHSGYCLETVPDLRECPFSLALDRGIDLKEWVEDETVVLARKGDRLATLGTLAEFYERAVDRNPL